MSNSPNLLQHIQQLQFEDKQAAEHLLVQFITAQFPQLAIDAVELRPLAISLNSFNGFLVLKDGSRLFFKTHTEQDNVIGEYYRAAVLAEAGYPVIQPLYVSSEAGKQLLIYPLIESPSVFDVAWQIEHIQDSTQLEILTQAQQQEDKRLFERYQQTLAPQDAPAAADAAIHQLFHHRLSKGRLQRFYGDLTSTAAHHQSVTLPNGTFDMQQVADVQWVINGQHYQKSLRMLINDALTCLNPAQSGASIIGHGDAHNGNVFLVEKDTTAELVYFDPAFAGRHHPLLDIVKPIFHNVFAMWMYFPQEKANTTSIQMQIEDDTWHIQYEYNLPPVRHMFLTSKVQHTLQPLLALLQSEGMLPSNWREQLKLALFCCPFLTMNLLDEKRFPPAITLLGLAMSVEMGAESTVKRSLIDQVLDEIV